jgi:hypothetical protein
MYNLRYWTPRAALMLSGVVVVGLGVAGFFADLGPEDAFVLDAEKRIILLVVGLVILWIGETWPSNWKQPATALLGIAFAVAGIVTLLLSGPDQRELAFTYVSRPWESIFYLAVGVANLAAALWPRPWRDYEWGTAWSSGLAGSPETPRHYAGEQPTPGR